MERSIWRQSWKIVRGMRSEGSINFGIVRNYAECAEVCKVVLRVGNRVAEYRLEYFCLDYVSKIGVSVMERNNHPNLTVHPEHNLTSPRAQEFVTDLDELHQHV